MNTKTNPELRVVKHFDASAERVFDAWLDPVAAAKWLFKSEEGASLSWRSARTATSCMSASIW